MEGHGPDIQRLIAQKIGKPGFELVCGLVGKGDGNDAPRCGGTQGAQRRDRVVHRARRKRLLKLEHILLGDIGGDLLRVGRAAKADEVCDAADQYRGLAAAGPRQQQKRTLGGQRRLKLPVVEIGKLRGNERAPGGEKTGLHGFVHRGYLLCLSFPYFTMDPAKMEVVFYKFSRRWPRALFSMRETCT